MVQDDVWIYAGKEELVNWREKQEKEGNPSIRLTSQLWSLWSFQKIIPVAGGVPPPPRAVPGTSSWVQVSVTAELIIPLEGGLGSHPAC